MTCPAGFPFFDCRVTLLARPTFRDINSLAHPAGSTLSKRDNQCVHKHFFQLLARARGLHFFLMGWFSWEGDPLYQGNFSPYKQCLRTNQASDNLALAVKPFNLIGPKCDQLQFFLNNINTSSIEMVMRINKMVTKGVLHMLQHGVNVWIILCEVDLNLTKGIKLPILVRDVKDIRVVLLFLLYSYS